MSDQDVDLAKTAGIKLARKALQDALDNLV